VRASEALKAEENLGATEVLLFEECQTTISPPKLHKVDKVVTKSDGQLIYKKWHLHNQITEILQYTILVYVQILSLPVYFAFKNHEQEVHNVNISASVLLLSMFIFDLMKGPPFSLIQFYNKE
jgi:hypothetical protein